MAEMERREQGEKLEQPRRLINTSASYKASFFTKYGIVTFDLFAAESPILVNNFIFLSTKGFYDGSKFHRVVEGHVVQGGKKGGPGKNGAGYLMNYFWNDEFSRRTHISGTLSMANCDPNTNGSQFFVPLIDMAWLD